MDELETFVDYIYGDLEGYSYAPVKRGESWEPKFFAWPQEKPELLDWIRTESIDSDVYLAPSVFSEKRGNKESWKASQVVWVEFDGKEQIDFKDVPAPDIIVQTSHDTHVHCYWRVPESNLETIEEINTRLTYYLEADHSGVDATQVLRPPTSNNFKYGEPLKVVTTFFEPQFHETKAFDRAPKVEKSYTPLEDVDILPGKKLLFETPLPPELTRRIKNETPKQGSRSSFLTRIAHDLAEEDCSFQTIVSLLSFVDERVGKFAGRSDRLLRLSQLASLALHKVKVENSRAVYTLKDILFHTENLEWIYPGWLHSTGLMILSGSPGVGKTQAAINAGMNLVSGKQFLGKGIPGSQKEHRVLMWSLEMDHRELRYFIEHQSKELDEDFDYNRFLIVDESSSRMQYENLLEEYKPTVLIIDSLSELFEAEMGNNEARDTMKWLRKLRRRHNCAIILIHHNRKATEGNKKPNRLSDLYGSFAFAKDADTVVTMYEDKPDSPKGIEWILLKARFGPKQSFVIDRTENLTFKRREGTTHAIRERVSETRTDDGTTIINLQF